MDLDHVTEKDEVHHHDHDLTVKAEVNHVFEAVKTENKLKGDMVAVVKTFIDLNNANIEDIIPD